MYACKKGALCDRGQLWQLQITSIPFLQCSLAGPNRVCVSLSLQFLFNLNRRRKNTLLVYMTMLSLNACLLLRLRVLRTHLYNLFTDCSNFVALKNIHRFVFSCFPASVRVRDVVFVAAVALLFVCCCCCIRVTSLVSQNTR